MSEETAEYLTFKPETMANDVLHQALEKKLEEQLRGLVSVAIEQEDLSKKSHLFSAIAENAQEVEVVLEIVKRLLPSEDKERERERRRRNRRQQAGNTTVSLGK